MVKKASPHACSLSSKDSQCCSTRHTVFVLSVMLFLGWYVKKTSPHACSRPSQDSHCRRTRHTVLVCCVTWNNLTWTAGSLDKDNIHAYQCLLLAMQGINFKTTRQKNSGNANQQHYNTHSLRICQSLMQQASTRHQDSH